MYVKGKTTVTGWSYIKRDKNVKIIMTIRKIMMSVKHTYIHTHTLVHGEKLDRQEIRDGIEGINQKIKQKGVKE